jgi:hypothetical protein
LAELARLTQVVGGTRGKREEGRGKREQKGIFFSSLFLLAGL